MPDKVLSPEEALAKFQAKDGVKEAVASSNFNPGFRLQNEDNVKTFMQGILLRRREAKNKRDKVVAWYTFKLSQLNVPVTKGVVKKGKTEYVEIPFVEGMEADTMSAKDMDNKLKDIPAGTEVLVVFKGKKTVQTKQGSVRMYDFTVLQDPSSANNEVARGEDEGAEEEEAAV